MNLLLSSLWKSCNNFLVTRFTKTISKNESEKKHRKKEESENESNYTKSHVEALQRCICLLGIFLQITRRNNFPIPRVPLASIRGEISTRGTFVSDSRTSRALFVVMCSQIKAVHGLDRPERTIRALDDVGARKLRLELTRKNLTVHRCL
jgi:hypothetical protein